MMMRNRRMGTYALFMLFFAVYAKASDKWIVNPNLYEYSMTVTGVCQVGDSLLDHTEKVVVGAFNSKGKCVGKAKARYYRSVKKYRVPLMVYGNTNDEELELKAYFEESGAIADIAEKIVFRGNASRGNFGKPQIWLANNFPTTVAKIGEQVAIAVYPNPTFGHMGVKVPEALVNGQMVIYNETGRELLRKSIMDRETTVDLSPLPQGTYVLHCSNKQIRVSKKVMKLD